MSSRCTTMRVFLLIVVLAALQVQSGWAANQLVNPGFESIIWFEAPGPGTYPDVAGWTWVNDTANTEGAAFGTGLNFFPNRTGSNNLVYINWTGKVGSVETGHLMVYQDVAVNPNSPYTASVWVRTANIGGWMLPVFGETPTDSAGLIIVEMREDGSVISEHPKQEIKTVTNAWQKVSDTFVTSSETAKVRFILDTVSAAQYNCCPVGSWVQYDDAMFEAPAPPAALSGTVLGDGASLEGALVEAQNQTTTTSSEGTYSFSGLEPDVTTVRASKPGYFAQRKSRTLESGVTTPLNFDLKAIGSNLLSNAGFDDGWNAGWKTWVSGNAEVQSESWSYRFGPIDGIKPLVFYDSGEEGAAILAHVSGAQGRIYQSPAVLPNTEYTVRCRFHATEDTRTGLPPSQWGNPADDQKAALFVQEYDKFGSPVGAEHRVYAAETKDWETLEFTFTTSPQTRFVDVGGWANLIGNYDLSLERATFDSFEFNGPAGQPMPPLYGRVTSGDTPLPGAAIELVGTSYSTTAESDGYWSMNVPAGAYTVRAGKAGYYTQGKTRTTPSTCLFDLVPLNLLANAGFDDEGSTGWSREWDQPGNSYIWPEQSRNDAQFRSGESAMFIAAMNGYATSRLYQDVPIQGGQNYTARAWVRLVGASWGWGETPNTASLIVKEYDALGNEVGFAHIVNPTITAELIGQWQQMELQFTSDSQAVKARVIAEAFLSDSYSATGARITWDDLELNGPAGVFGLHGTVTGDGSPIAGAHIEAHDESALPRTTQVVSTSGSGGYVIDNPVFGHRYRVRASKPGYFAQRKYRVLNGDLTLDYSLVPVGTNLMLNTGFDDGLYNGAWRYIQFGGGGRSQGESFTEQWSPFTYYHSGEEAMEIVSGAGGDGGWIYQQIPVMPSSTYTASVWFRAGEDPRYGSQWGIPDDLQKAALYVEEYTLDGTLIPGSQQMLFAQETKDWEYLSLPVVTGSQTAYLRVGGYARMMDGYDTTNLARAIFEDFVLTGPAVPSPTISDTKALQDGATVYLSGKVVSASFDGYFYIEEPDRSSGIRVMGQASVGNIVTVSGTLSTVQGERTITEAGITETAGTQTIDPLGMTNKELTSGPSPIGLYVKCWGRVQSVDSASGSFLMTDGSGDAVKVYGSAVAGQYVLVTGAAGAELSGSTVIPVIRSVSITEAQ